MNRKPITGIRFFWFLFFNYTSEEPFWFKYKAASLLDLCQWSFGFVFSLIGLCKKAYGIVTAIVYSYYYG